MFANCFFFEVLGLVTVTIGGFNLRAVATCYIASKICYPSQVRGSGHVVESWGLGISRLPAFSSGFLTAVSRCHDCAISCLSVSHRYNSAILSRGCLQVRLGQFTFHHTVSCGDPQCYIIFWLSSSCSVLVDWSLQSEIEVESGSSSVRGGSF